MSAIHRLDQTRPLHSKHGCTGDSEYRRRQTQAELASAEYARRIEALLGKMKRGEA